MTNQAQILALHKGAKGRAENTLTAAYHAIQKDPMLSGITKVYQPRDNEGEALPGESQVVQVSVEKVVADMLPDLKRVLDLGLTMDQTNTVAKANVEVDGHAILENVPVTFLLPLEKRLVDLRTFIQKLPTLDSADKWEWDENAEAWRAEPVHTVRGKKVPRNHEKAPATDKHPAQVEVYFEDIVVGDWTTTKFSGKIPLSRKTQLTNRIDTLIAAVVSAREAANATEAVDKSAGQILDWLFAN